MTKATKRKPTLSVPQKPIKKAPKASENFSLFFAAGLYGAVFSMLYLLYYLHHYSNDAHTYFRMYVWGWLVALGTSAVAFFPLKIIREKWYSVDSCLYPMVALINLISAFYVYQPAHWEKLSLLSYFLLIQPASFLLAGLVDRIGFHSVKVNFIYSLMMISGMGWFTSVYPGWYQVGDWTTFNYIFFTLMVGIILIGIKLLSQSDRTSRLDWIIGKVKVKKSLVLYFLAFLAIAFCINTLFNYDPHHYSFYLGPVADLAAGKSMLVNINCQYGVLVIYFLRFCFLFLPMSLISFSLLLVILTGIQYLLYYFVARHLLRSELLAFSSLVVLLIIQHLAQNNLGILFPSVGPLRFGFIYLLMALIVLRNHYPVKKKLFFWLESLVVGIAFFWSLEVCVYVIPPYLGLLFFEALDLKDKFRIRTTELLQRVGMLAGCVLLIGCLLYLDIFRRTHEWPYWASYFDYLTLYGNGFGMLQLPALDYWWAVVFIFYFSLFAILGIFFSRAKSLPPNLNVVAILLFTGVLEFTYYLRRAHENNLFHLSMAPILLFFYWICFIRRYDPPSIPGILKKAGYVLTVLLAVFFLQKSTNLALQEIKIQPTSPVVMINRTLGLFPQFRNADSILLSISDLMDKYSGKARSLVYFLGQEGLYVSMYTGRTNVYPFNDTVQASVSPIAMAKINSFDPHLKAGDCIYYGSLAPDDFEVKLFEKIREKFNLEMMEQSNGVTVYKVVGEKAAS